ncbi:hypothetical protein RB195_009068 [Necator americanus]|uniref:Uncharacterized protein n=1 Tax=Necator americanus TaxID=51031 RepID=A0ABR1CTH8_NECAM
MVDFAMDLTHWGNHSRLVAFWVARLQVADRGLIADQKRHCASRETRVDAGNGLFVSAEPGLNHDIPVLRTSIRAKLCNGVTGRYKEGGLGLPPTNKLHSSTLRGQMCSHKHV